MVKDEVQKQQVQDFYTVLHFEQHQQHRLVELEYNYQYDLISLDFVVADEQHLVLDQLDELVDDF